MAAPGGLPPRLANPVASHPAASHLQTETCARCHSRRGRIWDEIKPGEPLHQGFRLALLEPDLYFPDGQIKDEVFVFGSFIQSRMYHQGVVCGDCHDAHSLRLHADGNAVCARCHLAPRYDTPEHHHHPAGSTGAACVACHMPQRLLHGGGRAGRSQSARAATGSVPQARHPQRLQWLSHRPGCRLGGHRGGDLVSRSPVSGSSLWRGPLRGGPPRPGCDSAPAGPGGRPGPARHRAGQRPGPAP